MKKSLYFVIGLAIGALGGIGGTYVYLMRKQVETLAEVTDQLREYYSKNPPEKKDIPVQDDATVEVSEAAHEKSCASDHKFTQDAYKDYTKCRPVPFRVDTEVHENEDGELESETLVKMGEEEKTEPYSIPPEDFDSDNGYKKIMLTWYEKNHVLAYDNNPRITIDPDIWAITVGDFQNHFNDWEKDTVYMRDDVEEIDYEIDACITDYDEMIKVYPWSPPDEEEGGPIDG